MLYHVSHLTRLMVKAVDEYNNLTSTQAKVTSVLQMAPETEFVSITVLRRELLGYYCCSVVLGTFEAVHRVDILLIGGLLKRNARMITKAILETYTNILFYLNMIIFQDQEKYA